MDNLAFIDNHTHGAFGVDFNYANYDEIKYLLEQFYKKNIKGICPTLVGDSSTKIQKQLQLFQRIKQKQLSDCSNECFIIGVHLEGSFLSPYKSGIQDKSNFKIPTIENFKNLVGDYEDIIKIVTIAPEEDNGLIKYLNKRNILTQAGHTVGQNINNCKGITHHFNAMNPIHHRENSIALKGLLDNSIYCEIIADLIHTNKDILKLFFKTKSKSKILLISDSLPCSNFDKEIIFCNKKIYSNGKDENNTLAGSIKTLDEICINLIDKNILKRKDIEQMAFNNQIKYLKLNNIEVNILNR